MTTQTLSDPPQASIETKPTDQPKSNKPQHGGNSSLFRVVWRWHFYAGIMVAPVLVIVALTGAVYLFSAEITDAAHRDYLFVPHAAPSPGEGGASGPRLAGSPPAVDAEQLVQAAEAVGQTLSRASRPACDSRCVSIARGHADPDDRPVLHPHLGRVVSFGQ